MNKIKEYIETITALFGIIIIILAVLLFGTPVGWIVIALTLIKILF